jgi:hypothetical protein
MDRLDTHERLRNAARVLSIEAPHRGDTSVLLEAWEYLKGLRLDDFPVEIQPAFSFLEHEIARAKSEELSAREVKFLAEKICRLELMWVDKGADSLV